MPQTETEAPAIASSRTNPFAVASLATGVVGLFPLGFIFGGVALKKLKWSGDKGRRLAMTGLALSAVWFVAAAVIVFNALPDSNKTRARNGPLITVGDCFNKKGLAASRLYSVACDKPHTSEAFAILVMNESTFPGMEAVREYADERCVEEVTDYVMDSADMPEDVEIAYYAPTDGSRWADGNRFVTCLLNTPGRSSTTSLRKDETNLNADQVRFLKTANRVVTALDELDVMVEDKGPWQDQKAAAAAVAAAVSAEAEALRTGPWPAAVQAPVREMLAEDETLVPLWQAAAAAADPVALDAALDDAFDATDDILTDAVRESLGLKPLG